MDRWDHFQAFDIEKDNSDSQNTKRTLFFFKGAVGFTVSAGKYGQNAKAIRKAVNKAGLRMVYVDRYFGISTC